MPEGEQRVTTVIGSGVSERFLPSFRRFVAIVTARTQHSLIPFVSGTMSFSFFFFLCVSVWALVDGFYVRFFLFSIRGCCCCWRRNGVWFSKYGIIVPWQRYSKRHKSPSYLVLILCRTTITLYIYFCFIQRNAPEQLQFLVCRKSDDDDDVDVDDDDCDEIYISLCFGRTFCLFFGSGILDRLS